VYGDSPRAEGLQLIADTDIRPRVFIASTEENSDHANAVQANLAEDATCTVESQGVMRVGHTKWDSLLEALEKSDYGVFVFSPTDAISARKRKGPFARDNVVLKLGMMAGKLGVERTFMVIPRDAHFHLPSDLLGVNPVKYDPTRSDLRAALGSACTTIREELIRFVPPPRLEKQVATRLEARVGLSGALDPLAWLLAKTANALRGADAHDAAGIRRDLKDRVLHLGVKILYPVIGPAGETRSRYLALEPGPPMTLMPTGYVQGRAVSGTHQQPFVMNTEHGNYVIGKLLSGEPDFYPDLDASAPPGFDPSGVDYRTFISAPVVAGGNAHGLLTADAPKADQLSIVDQDFVVLLARLVATGLEMAHGP
jgi:hypothetical protein